MGMKLNIQNMHPQVFGFGTNRTVGYIIAEPPEKSGEGTEAIDTVTPLANALGLTIDTSW